MKKIEKRQTIKEWEIEKGIEIKNPKGFWGKRSQIYNKLYTEKLFKYKVYDRLKKWNQKNNWMIGVELSEVSTNTFQDLF